METYHSPLLPPNTKSIRVKLDVTPGLLKPVKVAKSPATMKVGVTAFKSVSTKFGSAPSGTANFCAKVALTATGVRAPVEMLYAPESVPVAGELKSPVTMTGPLVVNASNLARVRIRDAPRRRWASDWSSR